MNTLKSSWEESFKKCQSGLLWFGDFPSYPIVDLSGRVYALVNRKIKSLLMARSYTAFFFFSF